MFKIVLLPTELGIFGAHHLIGLFKSLNINMFRDARSPQAAVQPHQSRGLESKFRVLPFQAL
jgi:hypothetical protein